MTKLPSAKIRESLEQRIIEGELGIGKRLDEAELSAQYSVSRTPVREALQRLAESGLAEHLPRRGTFVRAPSLLEIVEMFDLSTRLFQFQGIISGIGNRGSSSQEQKWHCL